MGITIEITDDSEIFVCETGKIKSKKDISIATLAEILLASFRDASYKTPMLPKNCIYYCKYQNGREYFVLECDKANWDFEYHGTIFKNVGVPKHLFLITLQQQTIIDTKLVTVKDNFVLPESIVYRWPYSNVFQSLVVCWGTASLPVIEYPYQLSCIPRFFFSQGNTDCSYYGANSSGLQYRELLDSLQGKEFNDEYLVPHKGYRFKNFIEEDIAND